MIGGGRWQGRVPAPGMILAGVGALAVAGLSSWSVLAVTPSPSASPTQTPPAASASPSLAVSPSPSIGPSPSPSPSPSPTPVTTPPPSPPPPTPVALPAVLPGQATLSASGMQVSGLRSIGTRTLATPAGSVRVLEVSVDSAVITGLDLQLPCVRHASMRLTNPVAQVTGLLTMDLTGFQLQLGATQITISLDAPASIQLLPLGNASLGSVKLLLFSVDAGQMGLSQAVVRNVAC